MDTLSDLLQAVRDDLTTGTESSLFNEAQLIRYLNRAKRKAEALFRWPEREDALKTSTVSGQEYYNYPDNWEPDSAWKLKVDGEDYGDPLVFKDYLYEQENDNPSGLTYMWSSQWRRFFIDPTPSTNGNNNIEIWGLKVLDALADSDDVTIFSYSMPECNEAIVLEAVAMLKSKSEQEQQGAFRSLEAKQILTVAYNKIRANQSKYEKTQPMFEVPDLFSRPQSKTKIGDFN